MIGAPGQCECSCHNYNSNIKNCKCRCQQCPHCKKNFILGLFKYHEIICREYYDNSLNKIKRMKDNVVVN